MKAEPLFTSRRRKVKWIWCYLLSKGANTEILDAGGLKPIDLVGKGEPPASAPAAGAPAAASVNPATLAEIRNLLENAASRK